MDDFDRWVEQAKSGMLDDFHRRAKRTADVLVMSTPLRDKGRYRNSFQAGIREPPSGTDPGHQDGLDQTGQAALESIHEVIDRAELGDEVFVSSDAAGIKVLEEGGKHTSPARMAMAAAMQWSDDTGVES